ncbi:MAG: hypothetical protein GQ570_07105 [Helicobacteraceae bacterium]|nr:hypothetical protein [Helicobacteraceae bacterium]
MFKINSNITAMNVNVNSTLNNKAIDNSLAKLSSGIRVTSAADDSSSLLIADALRSQSAVLTQSIKNANDGISVMQIADQAMSEQVNILNSIRVKTIQAAQDGQTSASRRILQNDINRLREEFDNISNTTSYNGKTLLSGMYTNNVYQIGADSNQKVELSIGSTSSVKLGNTAFIRSEKLPLDPTVSLGDIKLSLDDINGADSYELESVKIGYNIGEGLGALADVVNKNANTTGVHASYEVIHKFADPDEPIEAGTTPSDFSINDVLLGKIDVLDNDSNAAFITAVNDRVNETGVKASIDELGALRLDSVDGRVIKLFSGNMQQLIDMKISPEGVNTTFVPYDGSVNLASQTFTANTPLQYDGVEHDLLEIPIGAKDVTFTLDDWNSTQEVDEFIVYHEDGTALATIKSDENDKVVNSLYGTVTYTKIDSDGNGYKDSATITIENITAELKAKVNLDSANISTSSTIVNQIDNTVDATEIIFNVPSSQKDATFAIHNTDTTSIENIEKIFITLEDGTAITDFWADEANQTWQTEHGTIHYSTNAATHISTIEFTNVVNSMDVSMKYYNNNTQVTLASANGSINRSAINQDTYIYTTSESNNEQDLVVIPSRAEDTSFSITNWGDRSAKQNDVINIYNSGNNLVDSFSVSGANETVAIAGIGTFQYINNKPASATLNVTSTSGEFTIKVQANQALDAIAHSGAVNNANAGGDEYLSAVINYTALTDMITLNSASPNMSINIDGAVAGADDYSIRLYHSGGSSTFAYSGGIQTLNVPSGGTITFDPTQVNNQIVTNGIAESVKIAFQAENINGNFEFKGTWNENFATIRSNQDTVSATWQKDYVTLGASTADTITADWEFDDNAGYINVGEFELSSSNFADVNVSGTNLHLIGMRENDNFTRTTKNLSDIDLTTSNKTRQDSILILDSALKDLLAVRADVGSAQNQLKSIVNNISTTEVNAKDAESTIRDVDFASESANFSKHNILAQSGMFAMSQANTTQENVLKLLQ